MAKLGRRDFLSRGAVLISAGWAVPSFIAESARRIDEGSPFANVAHAAGRRVLVIVQLSGGNDGLNTVVPYTDPLYASPSGRTSLAVPAGSVLPLNGSVGLNPLLTRLKSRWDRGQVAIVQGVGYPNPNRSHFRGTEIWESATPDHRETKGWVGRYLEACACQRSDHLEAITVGSNVTAPTLWTEMSLVPAIASISSFRFTGSYLGTDPNNTQRASEIQTLRNALSQTNSRAEAEFLRQSVLVALTDAEILNAAAASYQPSGVYPANSFGDALRTVAQLAVVDVGTTIFYVSLGGFDTHASQAAAHPQLLDTLDRGIDAFMYDMEARGKANDVVLMTFSEFGRRLKQNSSGGGGTDHGTAAPMFLVGGGINHGLFGAHPSLSDLDQGDLKMTVDFRSVYATVLNDWLNITPTGVLGGNFPLLDLFPRPAGSPPRSRTTVNTAGPASPRPVHRVAAPPSGQPTVRAPAARP
ncbi:MAG: DUF1501 domain-containing protein [Chloroflexota bacterium]